MEKSVTEWLVGRLESANLELFEQAKEKEKEKEKAYFICGYINSSMKAHNLNYGKEYLQLLQDKETEAEAQYDEIFK